MLAKTFICHINGLKIAAAILVYAYIAIVFFGRDKLFIPTSNVRRRLVVATMLAVCFFGLFVLVHGEEYTDKYDGVNLEEILSSERLLNGYVNCLLELGPCTPDAKELKKNLPDAIENDCEKCTERQRTGADRVMHHIIDHRPDDWEKLEKKYNEDGSYKRKYLATKHSEEVTTTDKNEDESQSKESDES